MASSSSEEMEMKIEIPAGEVEMKTTMPRPNLPNGDLLGNRGHYFRVCVPLYEASVKGDWKTARGIINEHREVVRCSITENYETALHIAASAKSTESMDDYVRNLVSSMTDKDIQLQNRNYNTALSLAAASGNEKIARILVTRSRDLLNISGNQGMLPLSIAALYGKYKMVKFLYDKSNNMNGWNWDDQNRGWVLSKCVEAGFYDIALKIVNNHETLCERNDVLAILARKTNEFREVEDSFIHRVIRGIIIQRGTGMLISSALFLISVIVRVLMPPVLRMSGSGRSNDAIQLLNIIWTNIMQMPKATIHDIIRGPADMMRPQNDEATSSQVEARTYSSQVLFIAAEMGNTRFIVELIRSYPDLIWMVNDSNQSIFHVAVSHRQEGIYNLIHEIGMLDLIAPLVDVDGNNMLHLAAMNAKNKRLEEISGVALQMQRELLWYKEVKGMLPPSYQEKRNKAGLLPHELFSKDHKELMSASEKWMKDTASYCMVVAALIATIVFAAAFTVPGGYDQNKGTPLFHHNRFFVVFVISDAISLTFAIISILMFLYILTSRYNEQEFLEALPRKLMGGLTTLFISIVAMMVTFSVSFFVLYDNKLWILVPSVITAMASVPVIFYARYQFGLLADVYSSTYGSSKNLFKPKKRMLYL